MRQRGEVVAVVVVRLAKAAGTRSPMQPMSPEGTKWKRENFEIRERDNKSQRESKEC